MITKICKPDPADAHAGRLTTLACRCIVGLLVFVFAFEPILLYAQPRRRQAEREKKEKPKRRRSDIEAFSGLEEERKGIETKIEAERLSKAAYDAVIRPGRYIVGPSDVFVVVVDRNEEPEVQKVLVGATGKLVIPYVGAVQVAGLSLKEAEAAIQATVQSSFQHLDISITLTFLRTFTVNVVGEVRFPGAYDVRGVEQVSELIKRSGGLLSEPEGRASLRNIQVQRFSDEGTVEKSNRKADLALWRLTGEIDYNPFLLDGDQILVPARGDSISVSGAVQRPGNYEYAPGDRVTDLVRLASGLAGNLKTATAELLRLPKDGKPEKRIQIDLAGALADDSTANFQLQTGDKLYVEGREQRVTLEGEVRFPGAYPIEDGLRLKELIHRAGGFTPSASLAQASVVRQIDYGHNDEEDVVLNRLLSLPRTQLTDEEQALLTMKTQQVPGRLPVDFTSLFERGKNEHNIRLKGGDIIRIPRFTPSVLVNGSVLAPAAIPYDSTYTINDYIDRAGGFSDRAKRRGVIVIKGSTLNRVKASKVNQIAPGDAIFVPDKIPGQGWRIFRETLMVATQIATLILIIQNTRR